MLEMDRFHANLADAVDNRISNRGDRSIDRSMRLNVLQVRLARQA